MKNSLKILIDEFASKYEYLECEYHRCIDDNSFEDENENGEQEYELFEKLNLLIREIYNLPKNELVSDIYISNNNDVKVRFHDIETDTHKTEKVR